MAFQGGDPTPRRAVIGNAHSFWLHSSKIGFDLSHPEKPTSTPARPRVTIKTTGEPITVDPAKSALVIIDMQNFFLSPAFGKARGAGHHALDQLVAHAIPAARKAGIRVIWLNWGLTKHDLDNMPPAVTRAFGFEALEDRGLLDESIFEQKDKGVPVDKHGKLAEQFKGLGSECGTVTDPATGKEVDAGRLLMRDQWNSALYSPLDKMYEEGRKLDKQPDVWLHKNRMSGMWGAKTECEEFLQKEGIKTLFFSGVNTDQCVGGTLTDSFSKGYDCILLNDGCGTTSPGYAQECFEFNAAHTFGFLATCQAFAEGVNSMETGQSGM